jgi:hypothetical protein
MGNSRAVACKDFVDMQPMELQILTYFTRVDSHNSYDRLERTKAPDPTISVLIQWHYWDRMAVWRFIVGQRVWTNMRLIQCFG